MLGHAYEYTEPARESETDEPLDRLEVATRLHGDLTEEADQLLDHFVHAARQAGCSWAQIGEVMGVSKQAVQQQHKADKGIARWLRGRGGQRGLWRRFTPGPATPWSRRSR